jgi:hypothetical protein
MDTNDDLNGLITQMSALKADKKAADFAVKKIEDQITAVENKLFGKLDELEMIEAKNPLGMKVTISESLVPKVEDWDLFHQHIRDTGDFFLLQKRAAVLTCRESFQMARVIPGVMPLTLRKLTFKE